MGLNDNIKNYKFTELIYLFLIASYICLGVINNSYLVGDNVFIDQNIMYNIEIYIFYPILIVLFLWINKHSVKRLFKKIILLAICLQISYLTGSLYLITLTCFIFAAECSSSPKRITAAMAMGLITATIIVAASSQFGIIPDVISERFGSRAHYFGFYWYSYLPTNFLFAWIMSVYARKREVSWCELILELFISLFIYHYSTHRLVLYLNIIVLLMYIIIVKLKYIDISSKIVRFLSVIGFPICALISFLLAIFYNSENRVLNIVNHALSGRLIMGKTAFERYPVKAFGQHIILHEGGEYFYIDCGYIYALLAYGVVLFIIVMVLYTFIHWYSCRENEKELFVWITAQMIYTMINNVWLDLEAGTCLPIALVLFNLFINERNNKVNISTNTYQKEHLNI